VLHLEGVREVHFVTHSLGGLVVRHYLADLARADELPDTYPRVGRIVMLGPPNSGAAIARQLGDSRLFGLVFGVGGGQLAHDWETLEKKLAIPSGEFGIIAGAMGRRLNGNPGLEGRDDLVVRVEETRLDGARDFLVVPAVHSLLMNDPKVQQATRQFLRHGRFMAEPAAESTAD
jgi:pimeloyl-ACP methyl ester carboxylesterase